MENDYHRCLKLVVYFVSSCYNSSAKLVQDEKSTSSGMKEGTRKGIVQE